MTCSTHSTLSTIFPTTNIRFRTTMYINYSYCSCFFINVIPISKSLMVDYLSLLLDVEVQRSTLCLLSLKEIGHTIQSTYLFFISSHSIPKITSYLSFVTLNLSLKKYVSINLKVSSSHISLNMFSRSFIRYILPPFISLVLILSWLIILIEMQFFVETQSISIQHGCPLSSLIRSTSQLFL